MIKDIENIIKHINSLSENDKNYILDNIKPKVESKVEPKIEPHNDIWTPFY